MLKTETKYYKDESMFHGFIPYIMGTRFDILLIQPDLNHLDQIWSDITTELERLDKMLNRFDPHSEVTRLNNSLPQTGISISQELALILQLCLFYYEKTLHLFDITLKDFSQIKLNNNQNTFFASSPLSIDFGGFAKGYALRKIEKILFQGNIQHAFINFGNSSIMGIGHHPYGDCWKVSLLNPYNQELLEEFDLLNSTLSTSGNTLQHTKHIINPLTGVYNEQKKIAAILSSDPLDAEILSTVRMIADKEQQEQINKNFTNIQETIYSL